MKIKPVKAYKISCLCDDHGAEVLFADRAKDLRGSRPNDCDCEHIDLRVKRAPGFDKYSPGPVTIEQYINEGFTYECTSCGKLVYEREPGSFVVVDGHVFCKPDCLVKTYEKDVAWGVSGDRLHSSMYAFIGAMHIRLIQLGLLPPPTEQSERQERKA